MPLPRMIAISLVAALLGAACGDDSAGPALAPDESVPADQDMSPWPEPLTSHRQWTVEVVERLAHDPTAFTQGLESTEAGIIESTGERGASELRLVDPGDGSILEQHSLDSAWFGEGVTVAGDEVIQLTWQAGRALRYDATTLEPIGEFLYDGEGWGICSDDDSLWMSDGSAVLTRRDTETFDVLDQVTVNRDGVDLDALNELECIGEHVVANIWKSDEIVVIEPSSGAVVATIDAAALTAEIGIGGDRAVLNGVADLGDGTLLLGGKLWPTFFVVEVTPLS